MTKEQIDSSSIGSGAGRMARQEDAARLLLAMEAQEAAPTSFRRGIADIEAALEELALGEVGVRRGRRLRSSIATGDEGQLQSSALAQLDEIFDIARDNPVGCRRAG